MLGKKLREPILKRKLTPKLPNIVLRVPCRMGEDFCRLKGDVKDKQQTNCQQTDCQPPTRIHRGRILPQSLPDGQARLLVSNCPKIPFHLDLTPGSVRRPNSLAMKLTCHNPISTLRAELSA